LQLLKGIAALLLVCVDLGSLAAADPVFLTFTVRDRAGFYARDLKREAVRITADGRPVEVKFLSNRVDSAFVVVLENSPRTAMNPVSIPQWGQINPIDWFRFQMQGEFFSILTEQGPVLLAEFFEEFKVLQGFSGDDNSLIAALNGMQLNFAGIVLNNIQVGRALGRAFDLLKDRSEKRKCILLFTRTIDRDSYPNLEEYKAMLRNSDIDLYVVSFAPRSVTSSTSTFEEKMNTFFFRSLASETSGRAYLTGEYTYIDELFTDLKGRLGATWVAGFYSPFPERGEHELKLTVELPKAVPTYRKNWVF